MLSIIQFLPYSFRKAYTEFQKLQTYKKEAANLSAAQIFLAFKLYCQ